MSDKSIEIRAKRTKAIELLLKHSESWNDRIYSSYDFQLDVVLRNCMGILPRDLGKEPFDYIDI